MSNIVKISLFYQKILDSFFSVLFDFAVFLKTPFSIQRHLLPDFQYHKRPVLFVKLSSIKFVDFNRFNKKRIRFFWPGDWDTETLDLNSYYQQNAKYRAMINIFSKNQEYFETEFYDERKKRLLRKNLREDDINKQLEEYFNKSILNFDKIKKNGFKSQEELGLKYKYRAIDEIGICIDSNGQLIKTRGGKHRFPFAAVLGLEIIPVVVHGIHPDFALKLFNESKSKNLKIVLNEYFSKLNEKKDKL